MKKYLKGSKVFLEWIAVLFVVSLSVPTAFFWFFGYENLSFWTLAVSVPAGVILSIVLISLVIIIYYLFKRNDD